MLLHDKRLEPVWVKDVAAAKPKIVFKREKRNQDNLISGL
jgi:hypothetical protein